MSLFIGEPQADIVCGEEVSYRVGQYVRKLEGEVERLKRETKGYETDLRVLAQERHQLALQVKKLQGEPIIESETV